MNITGTDANTLLAAQSAAAQRDTAQAPANIDQRRQSQDVAEASNQRQTEAPQTRSGIRAVESEDSGRSAGSRGSLPQDAQASARSAQERSGDRPVPRGTVVDLAA